MKTQAVIAAIRKHRGPVYVGILSRDDVIYVKVVKADLLARLDSVPDGQISFEIDREGDLYLDRG